MEVKTNSRAAGRTGSKASRSRIAPQSVRKAMIQAPTMAAATNGDRAGTGVFSSWKLLTSSLISRSSWSTVSPVGISPKRAVPGA